MVPPVPDAPPPAEEDTADNKKKKKPTDYTSFASRILLWAQGPRSVSGEFFGEAAPPPPPRPWLPQ